MIKSIEISSYGSIRDTIRLPLGHVTLLQGSNCSGKSMICRAIATALTSETPLPMQDPQNSSNAKVLMEISHPTLGSFNLERDFSIARDAYNEEIRFGRSEVFIDGALRPDISIIPELVNFTYVAAYSDTYSTYSGDLSEERFFQVASRFLGFTDTSSDVARRAVIEILNRIDQNQDRSFKEIQLIDGNLHFKHWKEDFFLSYGSSCTSEKLRLLSDFLLEAAVFLGQYRNVLLILDDFPTQISNLNRYRRLSSPNIQVIMTTLKENMEDGIGADLVVQLEDTGDDGIKQTKIRSTKSLFHPITDTIEGVIGSYKSGMENDFIDEFVLPALRALNFKQVRRVPHHGVGELGFDIQLFQKDVFPGRIAYFGAQVKAGNIGSRSSGSGTISELIDQLRKILTIKVLDPTTQLKTSVDYAIAIIAGNLTPDAQRLFDDAFEGNRRVVLWDTQSFASLLHEQGVWPIILSSLEGRRFQQKNHTEEK